MATTFAPSSRTAKRVVDAQAVESAIRLIVGAGNVTELRALEATANGDRRPATYFGYFDDPAKLARALSMIRSAKGIYFTPNPVDAALLARAENRIRRAGRGETTSDGDITSRWWLLIDLDAKRPTGISASDAEHDAAIERARKIYAELKGRGWPDPIVVDSGNGGHLLYRIDLPADDGAAVKRCLAGLAQRFDDDSVKVDQSVFNPARIWKVPGTLACKGDDTADRPHRMARILSKPDNLRIVPVDLLQALADESPEGGAAAAPRDRVTRNGRFSIDDFVARHLDCPKASEPHNGGRIWRLATCPFNPNHVNGESAVTERQDGALGFKCFHDGCAGRSWKDVREKYEPKVSRPTSGTIHRTEPAEPPAKWQPFPVDLLPEPFATYVRECARVFACDPAMVALPVLGAMAVAIGNTRRLQLRAAPGWLESATLWLAVLAKSGTMKSPAQQEALRPVAETQARWFRDFKGKQEDHEAEMLRYGKELLQWKKTKNRDHDNPPEKPEPPVCRRCLVDDTTIEALAVRILENPRGVLMARDELAAWLGGFGEYKSGPGGDEAKWLSIHGGRSFTVDRKTGEPKTIHVPVPWVSIVGGIQPAILRRLLSPGHWESGLVARMLVVAPPPHRKRWFEGQIPRETTDHVAAVFRGLFDLEMVPARDESDAPTPGVVGLSPEAKRAWVRFYNEHAAAAGDIDSNDLSAAWSKLEAYAARLALIFHLARWAAGDADDPGLVDADSVRRGVALARWFGHETRRVYAMFAETDEDADRRKLVDWIEERGGAVTVRDLAHGKRRFRGRSTEAKAALDDLANGGRGAWEFEPQNQRGGRPVQKFVLATVPSVTTTITPTGDPENAGYGCGDGGTPPTEEDSGDGDSSDDIAPVGITEAARADDPDDEVVI